MAEDKDNYLKVEPKKKANSTSLNSSEQDNIPSERIRPNAIPLIPEANYIANTKHYQKYKLKWFCTIPSKSLQPEKLNL